MAMSTQRSKASGALPPVPADVSLIEEGGRYFLRNQDGLALYRYDLDTDGRSHCVHECSDRWPPFLASAGASAVVGEWRMISRGTEHQWAYRGRPVYTYAVDSPGKQTGDGIDGVWHVITP
jgi:predicted lipoprotein with Yx(FWY)xxD motif